MAKLFLFIKRFLVVSGSLLIIVLGIRAAFVVADTISDSKNLDVTAVVGNSNNTNSGGGSPSAFATVTLSGFSFPNAKLTLVKDGWITTTLYANTDGTFQITINNLTYGNYQFSIYAEDAQGIVSSPHTFNVAAFSSAPYSFSGIIIPPTISTSSASVKIGSSYSVFGYVAPGATVNLEIPGSGQYGTAVAGSNGYYTINVIANFAPGIYTFRTKANLNGNVSLYSKPVTILYFSGQKPPPPPPQLGVCVDYNRDGRINLIDFSILLYWFDRQDPPPAIDCNADQVIDIKDFSILMYFWTG